MSKETVSMLGRSPSICRITMAVQRRAWVARAVAIFVLVTLGTAGVEAQEQEPGGRGRIAGVVLDRSTGRPIQGVRVTIKDVADLTTDLDGRFRSLELAPGAYSVEAARIGFRPVRIDSVEVKAGETASADFALEAVAMQLEGLEVTAEAVDRPSSEAALLRIRQAAPVVTDGISAETMSRTPDSDAADAVTRVPGVSVVEGKFVVIRGLPERYNNTLLNGAEMVSPEPTRRVVPMNVFPASLLESITTTKTARPDRPGDFTGGSVEIITKEFPDEFVMQLSVSAGYNSVTTFEELPLVPWSGLDFLGIDDGKRSMPANPPPQAQISEAFSEQYRSVWTPAPTTALPDVGLDFSMGGQIGDAMPLGYAVSLNYSVGPSPFLGQRLFRFYTDPEAAEDFALVYDEAGAEVEWGAIGNFALRLGGASKVTLKNLYIRQAEESVVSARGFEEEEGRNLQLYQVKYVQQDVVQSQLAGEHFLRFLFDSRFDWRLTGAQANRDEPDNRQSTYVNRPGEAVYRLIANFPARYFARDLRDRTAAAQGDWTLPFDLRGFDDSQFKIGGLYRIKRRTFDALQFNVFRPGGLGLNTAVDTLPPELAFSPENLGPSKAVGPIVMERSLELSQSYDADDNLAAAYAMIDVPVLRWLRLVGGVRYEGWDLRLYPGGKPDSSGAIQPDQRREKSWLPSANITLKISDRMNVRVGAFRSLSRPDSREISEDEYISVTGRCSQRGNGDLQPTRIDNADVRWEFFPGIAELISISGFYKRFDRPIVETILQQGTNNCREDFVNAREAVNYGGELEFRKSLDFLPAFLENLGLGGNLLLVESRVAFPAEGDGSGLPVIGAYDPDLKLAGQSAYLINGFLSYSAPSGTFTATALVNYFDDRIVRYGQAITDQSQFPNLEERGRATVDAKVQWSPNLRWSLSASGKNLTNNVVELFHRSSTGPVIAESYRMGTEVKVGVGYAF